jgi:hypothetical protein
MRPYSVRRELDPDQLPVTKMYFMTPTRCVQRYTDLCIAGKLGKDEMSNLLIMEDVSNSDSQSASYTGFRTRHARGKPPLRVRLLSLVYLSFLGSPKLVLELLSENI